MPLSDIVSIVWPVAFVVVFFAIAPRAPRVWGVMCGIAVGPPILDDLCRRLSIFSLLGVSDSGDLHLGFVIGAEIVLWSAFLLVTATILLRRREGRRHRDAAAPTGEAPPARFG